MRHEAKGPKPEAFSPLNKVARKKSGALTREQTLAWGKSQLKVLGSIEARASAEIILEQVLGCERLHLYLEARELVPSQAFKQYQRLVARRQKRVPVDYLFKECHFWNEVLEVGPGCLIPRPSTEVLVEKFIEDSGFQKQDSFSFLDLGCGSGAIGIALLRYFPKSHAVFSDISKQALEITRKNLKRYGLLKCARLVRSDLFRAFESQKNRPAWNVILSNPPYLSDEDLKLAQPEILYEPRVALTGGRDGVDFYKKIAQQAPGFLKKNGQLVFEMGKGQARQIKKWCLNSFATAKIFKDYASVDRVLIARLHG